MTTTFGEWLKRARNERAWSYEDLSDKVAYSPVTIRKLESGMRQPSRHLAGLLAEVFGIPSDERDAFIAFARRPVVSAPPANGGQAGNDKAPWRTSRSILTNLPVLPTALIGREHDGAALSELLLHRPGRLLTLTGPPGVGKTTVAIAVAGSLDVSEQFPDGVFYVALAPISEPSRVSYAIATALGLNDSGAVPLPELLRQHLAGRRLLLVLDNFEHVIVAAAQVSELLAAGPWLKVLVTSRAELDIRGERVYPLAPLELPRPQLYAAPEALDELRRYSAIALYAARAAEAVPGFALTSDNAALIAKLCQRLDGLPLAIELVAARSKFYSTADLLRQLENGLDTVVGPRDLPSRQRTLAAAIGWSYRLLPADEQRLLRRMAVFAGGADAAATSEVGAEIPAADSWRAAGAQASSLVAKSLLKNEPNAAGEPRYSLLETIRAYAWEQLEAEGETTLARDAHAAYFTRLAIEATSRLRQQDQKRWFDLLRQEEDNLRAALDWMLQDSAAAPALVLAAELGQFWYLRGSFSEARRLLDQSLRQGEKPNHPLSPVLRARALNWLGWMAANQSDLAAAEPHLQESINLLRNNAEQDGAKAALAQALHALGYCSRLKGDFAASRAAHSESAAIRGELGDTAGVGISLFNLSLVAKYEEDYQLQGELLDRATDLFRASGNHHSLVYTLEGQAGLALQLGDLARAARLIDEFLALYKGWEDRRGVANGYFYCGNLALKRHDYERSAHWYRESLMLYREIGDRTMLPANWESMAAVAAATGQFREAAIVLGASAALRPQLAPIREPLLRETVPALLTTLRTALDEDDFAAAWNSGAALNLQQVMEYVLRL